MQAEADRHDARSVADLLGVRRDRPGELPGARSTFGGVVQGVELA
jgi:hypothetical protein